MRDAVDRLVRTGIAEWDEDAPWGPDDFLAFAEATGLQVPSELRLYLEQFGKLWFEFPIFEVTFQSGSTHRTELGTLGGGYEDLVKASLRYLDQMNTVTGELAEPARVPEGYIHIGDAEGKRSVILMDGVNTDNNAVYLWGISYDPWGQGDNAQGLGRVADSLAGWLEHLSLNPNG